MKIVYIVFVFIVALFAVIFAAQNGAAVTVTLFSWSATQSLSLVLIVTLFIGIVLGLLVVAPSIFKRTWNSMGLKKQLEILEKEKADRSGKSQAAIEPEAPTEAVPPEASNKSQPKA
ncbi:MAG: LapA family protein [Spirochaetes bacterium]|nr:LapA family protein [Spirochaetota bacterium]